MHSENLTTKEPNLKLAFSALNDCNAYIETIIEKALMTCKYYNENKIKEADIEFVNIIELMDLYIQLISSIRRALREVFPQQIKKAKSIHSLEIHLLSILKAMLPAKEKNDIIMLSDLLEYELVDNLTQWKIQAIPELNGLRRD